jgi:anthranilate synthase component 1
MDVAITIRSIVVSGSNASVQAGAGIVADSVPEKEHAETEHKMGAMLQAIASARRKETR